MSTGSVNPFTPIPQGTTTLAAGTVAAAVSFQQADVVLVYNSGSVVAYVELGTQGQTLAPTVPGASPGGMPIPGGAQILLGTPGVTGFDSNAITQMAAITASGSTTLYITPGAGTQR